MHRITKASLLRAILLRSVPKSRHGTPFPAVRESDLNLRSHGRLQGLASQAGHARESSTKVAAEHVYS